MKKFLLFFLICGLLACSSKKYEYKDDKTYKIAREVLQRNGNEEVKLRITQDKDLKSPESYRITQDKNGLTISSSAPIGLLYGAFALNRFQEKGMVRSGLDTIETPFYPIRILNHWDNLDGTIERGYAGRSLWKWDELPDSISPRYEEYALKCAETGINGAVLNNVNASPKILSSEYLVKVKTLADILRPYGIKTYLSVNFASPMIIDSLSTSDPLNPEVDQWWKDKAVEIYTLIPDFGGFLVKANSEGQPGPGDYGRSHSEGANMIADALALHDGVVMWRAFVYSPTDDDRAKQAYNEFKPLDGEFRENVIIQVKNGPIDFQPREPFHPLFGAMQHTPLMAEFQITQEYLGHANHLAYLAPMWKEFFSDVKPESLAGIAGVANTGDNKIITGNPLADANMFAFGRLAWNPDLSSEEIIDEWTRAHLFNKEKEVPESIRASVNKMFLDSREAVVEYMMPLGLHHIFAGNHHYGPEPWYYVPGIREDWTPKYYHKADKSGIGFDRTSKGSNAVSQYPDSIRTLYENLATCPENLLLWFHHVPWTYKLKTGNSLWDEMSLTYQKGVNKVDSWGIIWDSAAPYIDEETYEDVRSRLCTQRKDARWWRDACLLYFQQFSEMPLPEGVETPAKTLPEYMKIVLPITNFENPDGKLLDNYR